jgi:hypothetical protein
MDKFKGARESTYMWSAIMILLGVVLILLGKVLNIDNTIKGVLEFVGITFVGVFAVSLIYQRFVAEKHFEDFKGLLASELKEMDSIQSKCMKLGINEIFETRNIYETEYPLMNIIKQSPEDGKIICIARSLFHLLNKTGELKIGLEKGLTFELALIDPDKITPSLEKVSLLYKSDIDSALRALKDLLSWAIKAKPKGSIELRYHWADFPDSVFIFTSEDRKEKLVWDISFGRDLTQKRVIILDTDYPLGKDLKSRYMTIYQNAILQIKYSNGDIKHNSLGLEI